jgi:eukaryotic-like serine/threonine-protein kinase
MSDDLKRGARLGNLELLLRIGRGGMATVWVARQRGATRDDDRLVAVKAILPELAEDPEFVKMFLDEGRLVRSIRHPAVVDTYEVGDYDGVTCMVMEWVEGDSLHTLIAEAGKRRPVPPEMAVRMIADAAAGLHAAHEARDEKGELLGVVHRDVSPHNILISTKGGVKLVDFGVAKAMGRLTEATSAGQLKGKFGYMSPEQAMAKPLDRRSDVFSLGIVLFELTTGRRLFRGEHDAETLHLVVGGEIPPPSSIDPRYPPRLEAIVMKALERDLSRRFQTAEEFQRELESYLKESRIVVAPAGLAGLLMKVLGSRIEQRRQAVRTTLKQLDGHDGTPVSEPPLFGSEISHSGISATGVESPSGPHSATGLSSPSTTRPQTVSGVSRASGGVGGWVFGVAGLLIALGVVMFVTLGRKGDGARGPSTVNVVAPAAASPSADQPVAAPKPVVDEAPGALEVSLDKLPSAPSDPRPGSAPAKPGDKAAATTATTADKPAAKPAATPAPTDRPKPRSGTDFQRGNPYGN